MSNQDEPNFDLSVPEPGHLTFAPVKPPAQEAPNAYAAYRFAGAGTLKLSKEQGEILTKPLSVDEIQHDRDRDLYYAGHAVVRARMNAAFGIGGWSLVPVDAPVFADGLVLSTWDLYAAGVFIARATGEQRWIASNARMTKGDALEGSRSNGLVRCCKDLGIGLELWNKNFIATLKGQNIRPVEGSNQVKRPYTPPARAEAPKPAPVLKPADATVIPTANAEEEALQEAAPVRPDDNTLAGCELTSGELISVELKEGEGDKGPWTNYRINLQGGKASFSTFDRKLGAWAGALEGTMVRVFWKPSKNPKFRDLIWVEEAR